MGLLQDNGGLRVAPEAIRKSRAKYVEVNENIVNFEFAGRGQIEIPVANAKTLVKIIWAREARRTLFRRSCNL